MATTTAPTSAGTGVRPGRLVGLDVARCLALLGMMATHLLETRAEDGSATWVAEVFSGRASALFAVLAGVTLALSTGGPRPLRGGARAARSAGLLLRALVVAAVGLALGEVDTGLAVILVNYAVLFCLGLLFVGWSARALAVLAVVAVPLAPALLWWVRPSLPERGFDSPSLDSLGEPGRLLAELLVTGYYPVLVWLAYLWLGMSLGRLDLRAVRGRTLAGLAAAGAVVAVAAVEVSDRLLARPGVVRLLDRDLWRFADRDDEEALALLHRSIDAGTYGQTPVDGAWQWLLVVAPHSSTPFDLLRTGGTALAVVSACLLLVRVLPGAAVRPLAVVTGAGTATLTLYAAHALMTAEAFPPPESGAGTVVQVAVVLGAGAALVLVGARGPLEAAVARGARALERALRRPGPAV